MDSSFAALFFDALRESTGSQAEAVLAGFDRLEGEHASECSRVLRSLDVRVVDSLRSVLADGPLVVLDCPRGPFRQ